MIREMTQRAAEICRILANEGIRFALRPQFAFAGHRRSPYTSYTIEYAVEFYDVRYAIRRRILRCKLCYKLYTLSNFAHSRVYTLESAVPSERASTG